MPQNTQTTRLMRLMIIGLASTLALSIPSEALAKRYRIQTSIVHDMYAADGSMQNGLFHKAEARYLSQLKQNPNNLEARAGLSLAQAELYKLDVAEKNAQRVLGQDTRNPLAHMALGAVYRNRTSSQDMTYRTQRDNLLQLSASELEKAVRALPGSAVAHNQLGITYRFQGRMDEALSEFQKASQLDPKYAEPTLNEGIVKMSMGDVAGAKAQFQEAIKLNSKNDMAHYRMGEALAAEGNTHDALTHLNTALSLNRGNAAVLNKMAEVYDKQGNTAAAIANYRKAIASNPTFMPSYVGLSQILDSRGDGELAMAELRNALNVNPKYNVARNQLGRLALTVDKPDQALQFYKEALQVNPQDPDALQGMTQALTVVAQKTATSAQAMGNDSQLVDAEQAIDQALQINPNDLRLHLAKLRISQLTGKPSDSEAELRRIVSRPPTTDVDAMIQGQAYMALGQFDTSDRLFRNLIQRDAADPDKLLAIADTLKAGNNLAIAKEAYQAALLREPGNIKAQRGIQRVEAAEADSQRTLRLAKALNNFLQRRSSIDFYEQTLAQNPRQPDAWMIVAKMYEKKKLYPKAIHAYQSYMGLSPNLSQRDREHWERKIQHLQELAAQNPSSSNTAADTTAPSAAQAAATTGR